MLAASWPMSSRCCLRDRSSLFLKAVPKYLYIITTWAELITSFQAPRKKIKSLEIFPYGIISISSVTSELRMSSSLKNRILIGYCDRVNETTGYERMSHSVKPIYAFSYEVRVSSFWKSWLKFYAWSMYLFWTSFDKTLNIIFS